MKARKTSRYISTVWQSRVVACIVATLCAVQLMAQTDGQSTLIVGNDTIHPDNIRIVADGDTLRPRQYVASIAEEPPIPLLQGFTLSVDVFNPILYLMSDYGSVEAALRVSLKNRIFPIVELGYGKCEHTDSNTDIYYSTAAPFLRVGADYNLLKNKRQDNRLMMGLRYGISKFNYDMRGPDISDPIWGGAAPFNYTDASSTSQWGELVLGVQVKILKHIHMGWSVRYKTEFSIGENDHSRPYYVPGYGTTTNTSCWGGTYNIIFDLRL